ncbi:MAG: DUF21 domain-containing protein [Phycisphaerales bacterium]|nr:DUF21 domain-containing protein [Phycisphaerae bacterium]NNM25744.1 DUF21 domain-containing protein [Phycisphaerales bacterium]
MLVALQLPDIAADPGLFGWRAADLPLLIALPFLLIASGLCSGSETALFGLTAADRLRLRDTRGFSAHAVERLLANPRMLLVTILLSNTVTNVLYFVISSVLLMRSSAGPLGETLLATGFLLLIVLAGEVVPKVAANATRTGFAATIAPPCSPCTGRWRPSASC